MKKCAFLSLICLSVLVSCNNSNNNKTYAMIETEFGNMKVELYNSTPIHKENFIKLANDGYYDGLLFHRVIKGFMIQGGDPNSKGAAPEARLGSGGPGYTLEAEIGAPHFKGVLAAARTGGASNPEKRSSGSQFYIVQGEIQTDSALQNFERQKGITYNETHVNKYKSIGGTPFLDMDYTAFGEVVEGLDVIDKIAKVATAPGDRPIEDVTMKIRML